MLIEQQLTAPRAGVRERGMHPGPARMETFMAIMPYARQHEDLASGDACTRLVRQLLFLS
jgi:hypothetical protein